MDLLSSPVRRALEDDWQEGPKRTITGSTMDSDSSSTTGNDSDGRSNGDEIDLVSRISSLPSFDDDDALLGNQGSSIIPCKSDLSSSNAKDNDLATVSDLRLRQDNALLRAEVTRLQGLLHAYRLSERLGLDRDEEEGSGGVQSAHSDEENLALVTNGRTKGVHMNRVGTKDQSRSSSASAPFFTTLFDRTGWLVGLMVLQSLSSFIIARNQSVVEHHVVIIQFLTMLVGAGGNAGNQTAVTAIRHLATGTLRKGCWVGYIRHEVQLAVASSLILAAAGALRAALFAVPLLETIVITLALWAIVGLASVLGCLLPLALDRYTSADPAHASTTVQVLMDVLGVTITVHVCIWILGA